MCVCVCLLKIRADIAQHFLHQVKQKVLWTLSYFGRHLFLLL